MCVSNAACGACSDTTPAICVLDAFEAIETSVRESSTARQLRTHAVLSRGFQRAHLQQRIDEEPVTCPGVGTRPAEVCGELARP